MVNKVYINPETTLDFTDDTTAGDYTLDLGANGASGNVIISDQATLDASGARPMQYMWSWIVDGFDTAPVVGQAAHLYFAYGRSATDIDGDLAATSGTSSTVVLPNLHKIATAVVQTTTAADQLRISGGPIWIPSQFLTVVVYNQTADAFLSTSDAHHLYLTPIPPEIQ